MAKNLNWFFYQKIWYSYQMAVKITLPSIAALPASASTRTRILTAGVEVLHSDGFAALTQHAVAEKAGVRQSHITYYFPTRLDLLQATAQYGAECMMQPISNAAIGGVLSFEEFRELLLPDHTDRGWWRLMTALVAACSESENIRNWIVQFDRQIRERLREGFKAFDIRLGDLDIEFLHASYIGAITLDMQELTEASQARARTIVRTGFDLIVAKARSENIPSESKKVTVLAAVSGTEKVGKKQHKAARPRIAPPPPRSTTRKAVTPNRRVAAKTLKAKKK
jgi:AcrR family transcriptional regulator